MHYFIKTLPDDKTLQCSAELLLLQKSEQRCYPAIVQRERRTTGLQLLITRKSFVVDDALPLQEEQVLRSFESL